MDSQNFFYICTIGLSGARVKSTGNIIWSNLDSKLCKQTVSCTVSDTQIFKTCIRVTCDFISISSFWYICPLSHPGNQYASAFIAIWKNQLFSFQNIREVCAKVLSTTWPQSSTTESLNSLFPEIQTLFCTSYEMFQMAYLHLYK